MNLLKYNPIVHTTHKMCSCHTPSRSDQVLPGGQVAFIKRPPAQSAFSTNIPLFTSPN